MESQQASFVYHVACWRTVEVQQARFDYHKACWTPVADYDTSVDYHEAYWVFVEDGATESVVGLWIFFKYILTTGKQVECL